MYNGRTNLHPHVRSIADGAVSPGYPGTRMHA